MGTEAALEIADAAARVEEGDGSQPAAPDGAERISAEEHRRLQARYDTLHGKYQAEVPRLHDEVKRLGEQLKVLTSRANEEPPSEEPAVAPHLSRLTAKDREDYPEEHLGTQGRVAEGVTLFHLSKFRKELERRDQELKDRLASIEQVSRQRETQGLWDKVDKLCPGAKAIDEGDPDWPVWLEGLDPVSGVVRRKLGIHAAQVGDIRRLADMIQEYKSETGKTSNPAVDSQLHPPRASADRTMQGSPGNGPVYKESEVKKFYSDVNKGHYDGRGKEIQKKMDEFDRAAKEGRIIPG